MRNIKRQPDIGAVADAAIEQYTNAVGALPCCYKLVFCNILVTHLYAVTSQPDSAAILTMIVQTVYSLLSTYCCNPIYGGIASTLSNDVAGDQNEMATLL